jgi:hypothetical protein
MESGRARADRGRVLDALKRSEIFFELADARARPNPAGAQAGYHLLDLVIEDLWLAKNEKVRFVTLASEPG